MGANEKIEQKILSHLINLIKTYTKMQKYVQTRGEKKTTYGHKWVKQGCNVSRALFNICIQNFQTLKHQINPDA